MNEYFYLTASNEQRGPVPPTKFEQLGITGDTLIWCKGMDKWERAENVPEVRMYLRRNTQACGAPEPPNPYGYQGGNSQGYYTQRQGYMSPKPDTNLVPAIIVTVFSFLCCGLVGAVAGAVSIYKATQVDNFYASGLYDQAVLAANESKKWVKYAIIFDIVLASLVVMLYLFISVVCFSL